MWVDGVISVNCIPEIFVIDDEMDITMYRINYDDLSGNQKTWDDLTNQRMT